MRSSATTSSTATTSAPNFSPLIRALPLLGALRQAFVPSVERLQAEQDLWFLRMKMICGNPFMLPRLLARGAVAEEAVVSAVATRTGAESV
ncbi:hypothetical protein ACH4U7_40770 [Streptomyces sp. NPDC020845]|uniref:acyl-CoA-like ligand-binding transcription factor n=1 Tax=Streptomyces sp. NPDC020845 TaxID=3365096 RepID=UPI0037B48C4A